MTWAPPPSAAGNHITPHAPGSSSLATSATHATSASRPRSTSTSSSRIASLLAHTLLPGPLRASAAAASSECRKGQALRMRLASAVQQRSAPAAALHHGAVLCLGSACQRACRPRRPAERLHDKTAASWVAGHAHPGPRCAGGTRGAHADPRRRPCRCRDVTPPAAAAPWQTRRRLVKTSPSRSRRAR